MATTLVLAGTPQCGAEHRTRTRPRWARPLKSALPFLTTRVLTQLRNRLAVRGKKLASPFDWSFHSAETPHPALSGAFRGVSVAFLHPASYQEAPAPPDRPR